jgi:hypothetical protein
VSDIDVDLVVQNLINVRLPVTQQIILQIAKAAILDDNQKFLCKITKYLDLYSFKNYKRLPTFHNVLGARAQQVDDVEVLPEVHHDFELVGQRLDVRRVCMPLDHFDGDRGDRFAVTQNSTRLCFHDNTKSTRT